MATQEQLKALQAPLSVNDIDFRVQTVKEKGCSLLGYKDARVDMKRLDEAVGIGNWKNAFHRDSKGILQCEISIYVDDLKEWVSKSSNGTESFADSQKGEYSDALKRAGFMWGIGRELYDLPFIWINFMQGEVQSRSGKFQPTFNFKPNDWTWGIKAPEDGGELMVYAKDQNGKMRFNNAR